ncbi:hypothetical protein LINPERHAP2_LOCUS38330, partial [Linum perenne]
MMLNGSDLVMSVGGMGLDSRKLYLYHVLTVVVAGG